MLTLRDGPVKGTFMCRRAPMYVRAVINHNGNADVLDQLDDEPRPMEKVHVYRLVTEVGRVHINSRSGRGFYALAEYEHMPEVDGEELRDGYSWRAWAMQQPIIPLKGERLPT